MKKSKIQGRDGWPKPSQNFTDGSASRPYHLFTILALIAFLSVSCSKPPEGGRKIKFYQCAMHSWITSEKPGDCTICGMALSPVYEGEPGRDAKKEAIVLSADSINVLGVTSVPARRLELRKSLRFTGILEDDENIHRVIAAFYDGRIDQIAVNHVGQYVEKGQPLASIYSPELLYVVREFQNATRGRDDPQARNSAQRLVQYGLSPEQVAAYAKQSDTVYTIDLLAPISGTVLMKKAYKGQYIKTGEPLFEMGDLSRLWFHAEVYERDLSWIRAGQKALLRTPSVPGREFDGVVTFVDPNFDEKTRTTKVRIEVNNPPADGDAHGLRRLLPHRAYAEADILADLGEALVVPRSAVLRDGRRSVVYVESGSGHYEQRTVKTGRTGDEGVEILDGLKESERVVTQGNLMIDAEAQLRLGVQTPGSSRESGAALPPQAEAGAFLSQLAKVSAALSSDDLVGAVKEGQSLRELAAAISSNGNASFDAAVEKLKSLRDLPVGGDLKAVQGTFLPWSMAGADLALLLKRAGQNPELHVFECPMSGDSFPGAPSGARWVQGGGETRNPYYGAEMLNCGGEIQP